MYAAAITAIRYSVIILGMAVLCSVDGDIKTSHWRRFTKVKHPLIVKELDFGKGSKLSAKQMLMWGEWVISFKVDSPPHLKPYAPVPEYAGHAFAIDGLQAYSNREGPAHAEIIYDGRPHHHTWDIDVWKTRKNDAGAPIYHISFYINGPEVMVVSAK